VCATMRIEDQKVQLIVKLHPRGGVTLSLANRKATSTHTGGTGYSQELIVKDLFEFGLAKEAQSLQHEPWPKQGTRDVVVLIPDAPEILTKLGFSEVGAITP
jgi:hypothetical protein